MGGSIKFWRNIANREQTLSPTYLPPKENAGQVAESLSRLSVTYFYRLISDCRKGWIMKIIEGFKHYPGVHCESTALRDVFAYHGIELSEPMVFGLGEGLSFIYWKSKQMPFPFVGGRTRDLTGNLCRNLNIERHDHFSTSFRRSWNEIRNLVDSDLPVFLMLDMYYLEYFEVPEHFGGHCAVLVGYDDENVYLADTYFESIQKTSLKSFELARTSKHKPFPPKNHYVTFEFPRCLPDLDHVIVKSIRKTAEEMLNPPIRSLGVKGIKKFSQEIMKFPSYPRFTVDLQTMSVFRYLYIYFEEAGTGGSCFRNLYRDFLEESLKYVDNDNLIRGHREYQRIAAVWSEIAQSLLEIDRGRIEKLREVRKKIFEVYELEKRALQILRMI